MEADPSLAPHRASFDSRYGGSCRVSDYYLRKKKGRAIKKPFQLSDA
jgi:hypothetical protein